MRSERVNLSRVLRRVRSLLRRYVLLPSPAAEVAVTLWLAHAYVFSKFACSPFLIVRSPVKRSGKSRLLEVMELLVPRPWRVIEPSDAVLYRKLAADHPTLLLDEVDALFGGVRERRERTEALRSMLNAGTRRGARVPRCVNFGNEVREFDVYGPKVLAGIGRLPDTIEDRGVVVEMQRATPEEQRRLRRFLPRVAEAEARPLREALRRWAAEPDLKEELTRPVRVPRELDARAAEGWEPLLAIARAAGPSWYREARRAAVELSARRDRDDPDPPVQLLRDLWRAFRRLRAPAASTETLLRELTSDPAAPWAEWRGRPLSARALAVLLEPFGVRPRRWREGGAVVRGYLRRDLAPAWERYCADLSHPAHPAQSRQDAVPGAGNAARCSGTEPTAQEASEAREERVVPVVPDRAALLAGTRRRARP